MSLSNHRFNGAPAPHLDQLRDLLADVLAQSLQPTSAGGGGHTASFLGASSQAGSHHSASADTSFAMQSNENWIGRLNEFCQSRGLSSPSYKEEAVLVQEAVHWTVTCQVPVELESYIESRCLVHQGKTAVTKKGAKQSAALAAFRAISI